MDNEKQTSIDTAMENIECALMELNRIYEADIDRYDPEDKKKLMLLFGRLAQVKLGLYILQRDLKRKKFIVDNRDE